MGSLINFISSRMEQEKKLDTIKEAKLHKNKLEQMVINDTSLQGHEKQEYLLELKNLHKQGIIQDDYIEPFNEFVKRNESEGVYAIKKSVYKQMSKDDTDWFHTKRFALYDDMNGAEKIVHYEYKDVDGYMQKTGDGQSVVHHRTGDRNVVEKALESYGKARQEIEKIKTDYEVRGKQFHNYFPAKDKG